MKKTGGSIQFTPTDKEIQIVDAYLHRRGSSYTSWKEERQNAVRDEFQKMICDAAITESELLVDALSDEKQVS